jgi:hypothetical protein
MMCASTLLVSEKLLMPPLASSTHIYAQVLEFTSKITPQLTRSSSMMCASTMLVNEKLLMPPLATSFSPQLRRYTLSTSTSGASGGYAAICKHNSAAAAAAGTPVSPPQ